MTTNLGSRFVKLWAAGSLANVADGIMAAAFPLLVATLTRDPLLVAAATLAYRLPWFVFELFAGELVDRLDRRRLMLWGDVARAVVVGLLGVLILGDQISLPLVYAIAFLLGIAETLVDTSWEALVPALVTPENLETANGRSQASEWTANELLGPPLGGFLFLLAAGMPFVVNAIVFLAAAALLSWIPGSYRPEREVAHGKGAMRREIGEGLRWLWNHKVLRILSATAGAANLVSTGILSVFVLFAQDVLLLGDFGFGVILAGTGIGGIIGALSAHRIEARLGPGTVLVTSVFGMAAVALTLSLTSNPIVAGLAFVADGFSIAIWNVVVVSLRQSLTPDELRGRVAADARVVAFGAIPIGAGVGGILAAVAGIRAPFVLAAVVYVVAAIAISRQINNRRVAELRAQAAAEKEAHAGADQET